MICLQSEEMTCLQSEQQGISRRGMSPQRYAKSMANLRGTSVIPRSHMAHVRLMARCLRKWCKSSLRRGRERIGESATHQLHQGR